MNQKEAKNALTALPLIRHIAEHGTSELEFRDEHGNYGPATGSWLLNEPDKYRIKPKPVTRPWSKPEDVPGPVCWLRFHGERGVQCMVVHAFGSGITIVDMGGHQFKQWSDLASVEHSLDRKTWHPCTVTEEA